MKEAQKRLEKADARIESDLTGIFFPKRKMRR